MNTDNLATVSKQDKKIRAFIAVCLPEQMVNHLVKAQQQLTERGFNGIKWVKSANFHVTLNFLGNVTQNQLDIIINDLQSVVGEFSPFTISMGAVAMIGGKKSPKIIWVEIDHGRNELISLKDQTDTVLERIGFKREQREFKPHITIARPNQYSNFDNHYQIDLNLQQYSSMRWTIDQILVMQSDPSKEGSVYSPLYHFELSG